MFQKIVYSIIEFFNPLSVNPEKWSKTLKQIVGNLPTICLSVFDHFMNLALKGLKHIVQMILLRLYQKIIEKYELTITNRIAAPFTTAPSQVVALDLQLLYNPLLHYFQQMESLLGNAEYLKMPDFFHSES